MNQAYLQSKKYKICITQTGVSTAKSKSQEKPTTKWRNSKNHSTLLITIKKITSAIIKGILANIYSSRLLWGHRKCSSREFTWNTCNYKAHKKNDRFNFNLNNLQFTYTVIIKTKVEKRQWFLQT